MASKSFMYNISVVSVCKEQYKSFRKRENQDNFMLDTAVASSCFSNEFLAEFCICGIKRRVFAVSDGMGSLSNAAETADFIVRSIFAWCANGFNCSLDVLLENINNALVKKGHEWGATLSMLILEPDGRYICCNCGDSPVFLIKNQKVNRIHTDHSEYGRSKRQGEKVPPENTKSQLCKYMGKQAHIEDLISVSEGVFKNGDCFVLCTDGIGNTVTDKQFLKMASKKTDTLEEANSFFVDVDPKQNDDRTIVVIEVGESDVE